MEKTTVDYLLASPTNSLNEKDSQPAKNSLNAEKPSVAQNPQIGEVSPDVINSLGKEAETTGFPGHSSHAEAPKANTPPFASNSPVAKPMQLGNVVGGKFAVDLMDSILPALVVYLVGMIGYDLEKKGLQFSQKEKDIIIPPMQDYLNSVNINFNNPLYNLLFAVGTVYAAKVIEILPTVKKKDKPKEPVKKETIAKEAEAVKEKIEKQAIQKQSKAVFIESLKTMDKQVAIDLIATRRKLGKQDAMKFYNENVRK